MKGKIKERKGITLIALVITIIVLLILAGVSIAMLTGENGILSQAQRAKTETENAAANEAARLDEYNQIMDNWINGGTTTGGGNGPSKDEEGFFEENSTINGGEGSANNPTIPEGFRPIDENGAEWGDGTNPPTEEDVSEGLVIEDRSGNQFVWVPVTGEYKRNTSYADTAVLAKAYTDTGYLPDGMETGGSTNNENAEREAIVGEGKAGGFYISRYEAGKETSGDTNKLVSKSGATVWNNIPQADCKTEAKKFINNDNVKSALCSGIQWDMTMAFVNEKQDGAGNTIDVTTNGDRGGSSPAASGQHVADRVCNIFDLEENYYEYVAEKSSYLTFSPFVVRGGLSTSGSTNPASGRYVISGRAETGASFRFVLYVM